LKDILNILKQNGEQN